MRSASVPVDESARLAALQRYAILDTAPEESFDRFVRLVTTIMDVEGAVISFVDADRQWFKARLGVDREQTPRAIAFSAHAILHNAPLIVLDATQDERFFDSPLVAMEGGVRFYASVPVRSPDGFAVGVLCAFDTKPHAEPPSPSQIAALQELAALVADELELRHVMTSLDTELQRRIEAESKRAELEQRLQDFLESASDWLWETDAAHRITFQSASTAPRCRSESALGRTCIECARGDSSQPLWRAHLDDLAARRPFRSFRFTTIGDNGKPIHVSVSGKPRFDVAGNFLGYRGTSRNITERVEAEKALHAASARFSLVYTSGVIGIITCTGDHVTEANDEFLRAVGRSRADLAAGLSWSTLQVPVRSELLKTIFARGHCKPFETECVRKDGSRVPVSLSAVSIDAARGVWMALVQDISERRAAEAQIRELAYRDTLTGLLNRRSFNEHLARRLARVDDRTAGALLLIDLDHFKDINDVIGHDAGDALLKEIAQRLQAEVRSRQDIVARLGGDEFAVILCDLADDAVSKVAQRLLETCAKPAAHAGQLLHCSASIGVTIFPKDGVESTQILKNADVALYKSKSAGRRVVSFFDPEMMVETVARKRTIEELRQAIAERQLRLAYQPIFELSGRRRRVGFEALVRWEHPQRGILPPSAFLEAATLAGLDSDLCAFTVDAAARQVREWLDQGIDPGYVAVNMSAAELRDVAAPARVMAAIAANRLQPRHLEIEITENVAIAHDRKVEAALEALHEGGIRIALDDFGTGYSSLVHLKQLPVDVLKIDQSFVRDMEHDVENATIAHTIVRLAHSLELTVVAEGIETEAQLTRLRRMGCDRGQGYLLAEPAFAADLAKRLSDPRPRPSQAA